MNSAQTAGSEDASGVRLVVECLRCRSSTGRLTGDTSVRRFDSGALAGALQHFVDHPDGGPRPSAPSEAISPDAIVSKNVLQPDALCIGRCPAKPDREPSRRLP